MFVCRGKFVDAVEQLKARGLRESALPPVEAGGGAIARHVRMLRGSLSVAYLNAWETDRCEVPTACVCNHFPAASRVADKTAQHLAMRGPRDPFPPTLMCTAHDDIAAVVGEQASLFPLRRGREF